VAEEEEAPTPDLMAALKASLDAVRDQDSDGNGAAAKKAPAKKDPAKKAPARKKAAAKR
jgi:hypothetical protein